MMPFDTYIVSENWASIGSSNGLQCGWRQVMSELLFRYCLLDMGIMLKSESFYWKQMNCNMLSAKWCPLYLGLSVLNHAKLLYVFQTRRLIHPLARVFHTNEIRLRYTIIFLQYLLIERNIYTHVYLHKQNSIVGLFYGLLTVLDRHYTIYP